MSPVKQGLGFKPYGRMAGMKNSIRSASVGRGMSRSRGFPAKRLKTAWITQVGFMKAGVFFVGFAAMGGVSIAARPANRKSLRMVVSLWRRGQFGFAGSFTSARRLKYSVVVENILAEPAGEQWDTRYSDGKKTSKKTKEDPEDQ